MLSMCRFYLSCGGGGGKEDRKEKRTDPQPDGWGNNTTRDLQRFDAADAADIRAARKLGLSYPKAINAAISQDGKRIGCARA